MFRHLVQDSAPLHAREGSDASFDGFVGDFGNGDSKARSCTIGTRRCGFTAYDAPVSCREELSAALEGHHPSGAQRSCMLCLTVPQAESTELQAVMKVALHLQTAPRPRFRQGQLTILMPTSRSLPSGRRLHRHNSTLY